MLFQYDIITQCKSIFDAIKNDRLIFLYGSERKALTLMQP